MTDTPSAEVRLARATETINTLAGRLDAERNACIHLEVELRLNTSVIDRLKKEITSLKEEKSKLLDQIHELRVEKSAQALEDAIFSCEEDPLTRDTEESILGS